MQLLNFAIALAIAAATAGAHALTYNVGPTRTHTTLQSVASLLNPGDVVEVDGNQSYRGARFTRSGTAIQPISLRGIKVGGARPLLNANAIVGATNYPDVLRLEGNHYVVEGFEVTGTVTPVTTRGIFIVAHNVTIRDCVVHDCPQHGILSADQFSGDHVIEYCEVYDCGEGTGRHQLYLATDNTMYSTATATVRFCYVHDANGGNSIKTRATRNEIMYNWVEGALHHELELIGADPGGQSANVPVREDSQVVGNVLRKRAGSTGALARVGGDGTGDSNGRFRFLNNTMIMGGAGSSAIRIFDHAESLEFHNNVFYHEAGSAFTLVRIIEQQGAVAHAGSYNWIPSNAIVGSHLIVWNNTLSGTNPGFTSAAGMNYVPTLTSPLRNAGNLPTSSPAGFAFPSPLAAPLFHPPQRAFVAPGAQIGRPSNAAVDIGAFEEGAVPAGISVWEVY